MSIEAYLQQIEDVIAEGKYKDNWASLSEHPIPDWFSQDKFGIFIHWGIYSVPAFGNEWYARNMYDPAHPEFEHHRKTYGEHKDFGKVIFCHLCDVVKPALTVGILLLS